MDTGDKYILSQIRDKNKEAFSFLFEGYFEELVRFAEKMLFDAMKSEDVVKDLFVHLWENATNLEIKTSIKAYLYQAVKYRCLNHLKKVDIKSAYDLTEIDGILLDIDEEDDDPAFIEQEISKAIKNLPEKMALVVDMKYLKGMKRSEIAKSLNISELTVKNQLAQGRKYLRKELKHLF
ncbi:RNA polymerase sigma-70 factor [Puteibacter caeruleilacunae]|nr:RNA polymerase sigma-70 factor [Puteibacter caeruleilacunae]